jgi:predicted transcriptional regulator
MVTNIPTKNNDPIKNKVSKEQQQTTEVKDCYAGCVKLRIKLEEMKKELDAIKEQIETKQRDIPQQCVMCVMSFSRNAMFTLLLFSILPLFVVITISLIF